ncbi:MAG: fused MFS/spermidine synthase, partial [Candidatus Hydrogenedens sp.]
MNNSKYSSYAFRLLLYVSFFLSGGSALMYQIIWTRQCMLLLGSTAYAVSTVLSIFFLGLGLGSFWGGKIAERTSNPMRLYAVIELFIGFWALIVIDFVSNKGGIVILLMRLFPESRWFLFFVRILISIFWFTLPSLCMGMTFPLLVRYEQTMTGKNNRYISFLYSINTLGAVSSAFLTGFLFIPNIGYTMTFYIAIGINVCISVIAGLISQLRDAVVMVEKKMKQELIGIEKKVEKNKLQTRVIFLGLFISGFVCLALEVLWTRLLIMIFLGTNYAYSSVLISVLAGICFGALCISIVISKFPLRMWILGWGYSFTGFGVLLTLIFISYLPEWMNYFYFEGTDRFYYGVFGKFTLTFLTLLIPMTGFGFTFPYALTFLRNIRRKNIFSSIGTAYGLNTIGSITGSLIGGFVLIPVFGCEKGIIMMGGLLILSGFIFVIVDKTSHWANAGLIFAFLPIFFVDNVMEKINRYYLPDKHHLLFFAEGTEGTVAVSSPEKVSPEDERVLWINRVQATTAVERGVRMNRFQGVIPQMFNRNPQQVLFMCFGSGITCGTLGIGGFERIDAVEISPEVLKAGHYFKDLNCDVLTMSNVKIYVDDARNFLIRSTKKYDFITTEPMPLAMAGVSMFYTQEFYQFCFQRLNEGG